MTDEINTIKTPDIDYSKESIKLVKNSRGFTWEIKIHIEGSSDKDAIERLSNINAEMEKQFSLNLE
jgi:hypothetical protein